MARTPSPSRGAKAVLDPRSSTARAVASKSSLKPKERTSPNVVKAAVDASARRPAPESVREEVPKHKLVRDSFTIPKGEYGLLEALKVRAANLRRPTKKSEILRAGIAALNAMPDKAFLSVLSGIPSLKTGRPKGKESA
jgi:hypothetical protein